MKKIFYFATIILFAGLLSSCENGGGGKTGSVTFRRMNLGDANTLALASQGKKIGNNAPARIGAAEKDELVEEGMAYSVSADGRLVEITYAIDADGSGDVNKLIKAHLRLSMQYVYAIGDDWLWLYACNYVCPDLDSLPEPAYSKIKEVIAEHSDYHDNYLVRRSDGALFYWDGSQGRPIYGNVKWDADQTDVYGCAEAMGEDVYTNSDYHIFPRSMVYRLKKDGNQLAVTAMHEENIKTSSIMPDKRGAFGLSLLYKDEHGDFLGTEKPRVMFIPSGKIVGFDTNYRLISLNETLYAIRQEEDKPVVYSVILSEAEEKAIVGEKVAEISGASMYDLEKLPKVNRGSYATWLAEGTKCRFDFNNWSLSYTQLPANYPDKGYYQGIAYVMSDDQQSFYICDLSKNEAEQVTINYDELNNDASIEKSTISSYWEYIPRVQAFRKSALTVDGYETTILLPVTGSDKGKARAYKSGNTTAGQVVSAMVQLN